jgi:hypothetical protein
MLLAHGAVTADARASMKSRNGVMPSKRSGNFRKLGGRYHRVVR